MCLVIHKKMPLCKVFHLPIRVEGVGDRKKKTPPPLKFYVHKMLTVNALLRVLNLTKNYI